MKAAAPRPCPVCGGSRLEAEYEDDRPFLWHCPECRIAYRHTSMGWEKSEKRARGGPEILESAKRPVFETRLQTFEPYRPGGRILDVGSGDGSFLKVAAEAGWNAVGIERSHMIARLSQQRSGQPVVEGSATGLPIGGESFEVVVLWDVLEHIDDPLRALREAGRVVKKGGLVHIRVRNGPLQLAMRRRSFPRGASVVHNVAFSSHGLRRALEMAGFVDVSVGASPLTSGDPYGMTSGFKRSVLRAIKATWSQAARLIAALSRRRWLISPSLEASAWRPDHEDPASDHPS